MVRSNKSIEELENFKIIIKENLEEMKVRREIDNELIEGFLNMGFKEEEDND